MPVAPLAADHRDEWQAMLDTNVMGVLNGISTVLPVMHKQGYGHILATDSVAGYNIYPDRAVYCGTKFAVRAIMESLRQEELPNKIKTTLIYPGSVDSELYKSTPDPLVAKGIVDSWHQPNKSLKPVDIASIVVYAISQPDVVALNEIVIRPIGQA